MKKNPSTQDLLDLFRFYSSDTFKSEQTKLARTANHVRDVATGKMKVLFSEEELEALLKAGALLNSVKRRVEAAKETKERQEKEAERRRKANVEAATKLLNQHVPDFEEGLSERVRLVQWTLFLHKERHIRRYGSRVIHDYRTVNQIRPDVASFVEEIRTRFNGAVLAEKNGASNRGNEYLPYDTREAFFRDMYALVRESCWDAFGAEHTDSHFSELFRQWLDGLEQAEARLQPEERALLEHIEVALFALDSAMASAANTIENAKKAGD